MLKNQKLFERRQCNHSEDKSNLRNGEAKKKFFKWVHLNKILKLKKMSAMISVLPDNGLEPIILYLFEVIKHFLKCAEFFCLCLLVTFSMF